MEQWRTLRNVAIVVAIGVGIYLIPGGGRAANGFETFLQLGVESSQLRALSEYLESLLSPETVEGDRHPAPRRHGYSESVAVAGDSATL